MTNNCTTNVVGPYRYSYSTHNFFNKGHCNPCPCSSHNQCDISLEFDYGTKSFVDVDWSKTLKRYGVCAIIKSEWFVKKEASIPLDTGDQSFSAQNASIYIEGGVFAGEYILVNRITTNRGDTLEKCVCIKLVGSNEPLVPIEDPCLTPIEDPVTTCHTSGMLTCGTYCKKDFCDQAFTKITFNVLEGCGRIVDTQVHELETGENASITNEIAVSDFCIIVDQDSKIVFELEVL